MSVQKSDLIDEYVKSIRNKVTNFDWKIQTSIVLFNFFKNKGYDFYFAPKIKLSDVKRKLTKTPDFHTCKEKKSDVLGEIKQSLPNPHGENYDKKASNDIKQLEEYTQSMVAISTPHDVFFATSNLCNEAISYYIEKIEQNADLKNKIIVLKYYWMSGGSHSRLTISKIYGNFSDSDINQEFMHGKDYQVGEGDLNEMQGYYKILYTEENYNETPVEYIMMVLWHNIIPEFIKSADFNKTIERIKKGDNTFEFKIDEIMEIVNQMYTLHRSGTEIMNQFDKATIIGALDNFVKLQKAEKLNDSKENPRYRIVHSKISTKNDLIEYLIREIHKEEFDARADVEIQKLENQDLTKLI